MPAPSFIRIFMRISVLAVALLWLLGPAAKAQTIWSRPFVPNQFVVEAISPDSPDEASFVSGATFFTATTSLNNKVEMVGELPVARFWASGEQLSSSSAIGNPYLGFGFSSTTVPFLLELGARIPAAPTNRARSLGTAADMGRSAAFQPDEFSLSTLLNTRFSLGQQSSLRLRTGFAFANSDERSEDNETAWRMQYDAQIWQEGDRLITGLSFTGRAVVSSPASSQHHLALSLMPNWPRVQPGLVVGISMNELVQDGTVQQFIGLTLSVSYAE